MNLETFNKIVNRCKTRRDSYVYVIEWYTTDKYHYEIYFEKEEAKEKAGELIAKRQTDGMHYSRQLVKTMLRKEIYE